ncbi:MAG: zinc dependent phospholipase C family protein [Deltaproteobacteria bacterium]|nr:zinc dependent phospholipase C family protein [Deltaproteobacteria bacterium]
MPKELTHILIAQDVLTRLKESRQKLLTQVLEKNMRAFFLGAILPDAFAYDIAPLRKIPKEDYVKISQALHSKKTAKNDETALGLFDAIKANPCRWPLKLAFAAGVVTHTVSDRIIHGVIDHYTTKWNQGSNPAMATHRQFETLIDMVLLRELDLHPRCFQLESMVSVDRPTEDYLFLFYLTHLTQDTCPLHPCLLGALRRAHRQQGLFMRLFTVRALYHIVNLSDRLVRGRMETWSSLFYPEMVRIENFPIMDRLDLSALTDGGTFSGTIQALVEGVASDALDCVNAGLQRL